MNSVAVKDEPNGLVSRIGARIVSNQAFRSKLDLGPAGMRNRMSALVQFAFWTRRTIRPWDQMKWSRGEVPEAEIC